MPTLDVSRLTEKALANAERIFHELKHERMVPFNEVAHDPGHHKLDNCLLSEVLNIRDKDVHRALGKLREFLSAEPSIHGGKKSQCNLEKELAHFKDTITPKESPHETWRNVR